MFIFESPGAKTLCIPSAFIGYHGEALDELTPLLRSSDILSQKTIELLELIGDKGALRVFTTLGPEQEYFLIDRTLFAMRPDLVMGGRTLIGAPPPRGQQLEDHYFGGIPERVLACIAEVEFELYKLGVPIMTRHNEVAPCQFEMAPVFEETDIAVDHNQLVMSILRKVALRHGLQALLAEKPFAGINGSGKHCNWSLAITSDNELDGVNLLKPGKTPHQNIRFLLILAAVLKAVHKHAGLIRAGIATSGNEHRLGANEAPPAIISVFMGDMLTRVIDDIAAGKTGKQGAAQAMIQLGVAKLPDVAKDNTDRNRTSPFAFTGAKFEFRAVGSSQSIAFPVMLLNATVAEAIGELTGRDPQGTQDHRIARRRGAQGDSRRVQEDDRGSLRGKQLLRRVGEGSQEARAAELPAHARGARTDHHEAVARPVHEPRHPRQGRDRLALLHPARAIHQGHAHRDAHARGDGEHDGAAGRLRLRRLARQRRRRTRSRRASRRFRSVRRRTKPARWSRRSRRAPRRW